MNFLDKYTFAVFDTETTGSDPLKDKVIELAVVKIINGKVQYPQSWLVDPECLIPPEASSVHHLIDEDVKGQPLISEVMPLFLAEINQPNTILVAHNSEFDLTVLNLQNKLCIDTLRFAKQIWPRNHPNEKNFPLTTYNQQFLRYWLNLRVDTQGLAPHRAAADILVTAELFLKQLKYYQECGGDLDAIEDLLDFINQPIEITCFPFGKFKNIPFEQVPLDYLEYQFDKLQDDELRASIKRELDKRKGEAILISKRYENV